MVNNKSSGLLGKIELTYSEERCEQWGPTDRTGEKKALAAAGLTSGDKILAGKSRISTKSQREGRSKSTDSGCCLVHPLESRSSPKWSMTVLVQCQFVNFVIYFYRY